MNEEIIHQLEIQLIIVGLDFEFFITDKWEELEVSLRKSVEE